MVAGGVEIAIAYPMKQEDAADFATELQRLGATNINMCPPVVGGVHWYLTAVLPGQGAVVIEDAATATASVQQLKVMVEPGP